MNGQFFQNPTFPSISNDDVTTFNKNSENISYNPESFEDYLKRKSNKLTKVYLSYPNNSSWQNQTIEGTLYLISDDYIVIKNNQENKEYLLKREYINYIEF